MKTVAPVGERVLVKSVEPEAKTSSGILLPTASQKRPNQGVVVGAAAAKAVKAGETVVYSKYAGTELEVQGVVHVLLKEEDLIGVMAGEDPASMRPLHDRVLIEVGEAEAQSAGGVLLTEGAKEQPTLGKVVAVGAGREEDGKTIVPTVAVGSTVLYTKYAGTEFEGPGGKKYIVVRDPDVLATLS